MKISFFLLLLLGLGATQSQAQTTCDELVAYPERSAGIYHSYEYQAAPTPALPHGYVPFYISHYGRHGSRYHSSEEAYNQPLDILRRAAATEALTPRGRTLLGQIEVIAADAAERYGDLSPRGVEEHRAIAGRMFAAYPAVFSTRNGRECRIESRSTLVPRCILSMAAFNERLKELNPAIRTLRESSRRNLPFIANTPGLDARDKSYRDVADSLRKVRLHPERLMSTLFADPQFVSDSIANQRELMVRIYLLAGIMQDVSYLRISLYDLFTADELCALWECENVRQYLSMGPSLRFGDSIVTDAKPLLRNIIETADRVIDGRDTLSASLRFGHDVNIVPLLALLGVEGASARVMSVDAVKSVWCADRVTPMAANLQLIFFRNAAGDVLVRVLHNERDAKLSLTGGPYYPWKAFRAFAESKYSK
ncbi:MAG: histidine-type phosphatase [Alistipes sp.]